MKQNSNYRSPNGNVAAATDNGVQNNESSLRLSSNFDNVIELLLTEMTEPGFDARKKGAAEQYILAALLLRGARPVLH
jgi:hypothetical protein